MEMPTTLVLFSTHLGHTHFPLDTLDDYLKRKGRKKVNRGKPVEWFERYRHHGISQVHSHMCSNKLA
jgi:hypothetical protein